MKTIEEKLYVSWDDIETYVNEIAEEMSKYDISGIYGPPRGGLIPAVMLSHRMQKPLLMAPTPNCLIVDDICDSGESLVHYIKNTSSPNKPKYYIATLFKANGGSDIVPDKCCDYVDSETWIVFPWERGNKEV